MSTLLKYGMRAGLIMVLVVLLSLGVLGTVVAGPPEGTPIEATYVDNQVHTISPHNVVWYRFDYLGDQSQITIKIPNVSDSGPTFELYTPAQLNIWWKADPIGMSGDEGVDHLWNGNFPTQGTYYVKVMNEYPYALPYQLIVEGKGVSLGTKIVQPPVTTPPKAVTPLANVDPNQAILLDKTTHVVPANTALWYRIAYAGVDTPILVKLPNGAKSGLKFEVYANEQIAMWWKTDPAGMGTPDGDDLLWSGYSQADVTHYVRIINTTAADLNFQFMMQTVAGPH